MSVVTAFFTKPVFVAVTALAHALSMRRVTSILGSRLDICRKSSWFIVHLGHARHCHAGVHIGQLVLADWVHHSAAKRVLLKQLVLARTLGEMK